jgi:hypothetical protein
VTTVFSRNKQGERRVSPSLYKLLLTTHIIVSVGWLGVVFAKIVLGLVAITTTVPDTAAALYGAMQALNVAFPPVAIGTIVTGVLLSLGTKWGLLQHYWVVTKIVLTVGVITTAVQLGGRIAPQSIAAPAGQAAADGTILGIASAPTTLLIALSVTHLLMLGAATVISVYKPWGKTWFGRRPTIRLSYGEARRRMEVTLSKAK